MMFQSRYLKIALLTLSGVATGSAFAASMQVMSDDQLSETTGQALMNLSYIAPTDAANMQNIDSPGSNIGFYKLGVEANIALNANIKKLQLGCGGANGAGACDIDIDNFSLSGWIDDNKINDANRNARVQSDAVLTNPFLEFAIKNPDSASTREVVGLRLSAEKALGMLTLGNENLDTPNGINSLSGYMKIKNATGVAYTQQRLMSYNNQQYTDPNTGITSTSIGLGKPMEGVAKTCLTTLCWIPIELDFQSTEYSLELKSAAANLFIDGQTISGNRIGCEAAKCGTAKANTIKLSGYADIGTINFSGPLTAKAGIFTLNKVASGSISGLKANVEVEENLGFIHKLKVDNPFSLSLQQMKIHWPNADAAAERGWWLAFDDEVDIGSVSPSDRVAVTNDVLLQLLPTLKQKLSNPPVDCGTVDKCLGGATLNVGSLNVTGTTVNFPLSNLKLAAQDFAPNCYGTLKFC